MIYRSTRNANETASASEAILKGLAENGGLFVPDEIPALNISLDEVAKMSYQEVAYEVMKLMFTDFTEEELKTLIDVGEKEGTIEKNESRMLNKIIKFNDLSATDIMKHRAFVSMVSASATYDEVVQEFLDSGFSTLTVYKDQSENVVGIIHYKKVLYGNDEIEKGEGYAGRVMDDVLYVPGTFSALELLQKLREDENRFAVVLNEQGQTAGIVTIEDVIRVVFGRMTDENSYDNIPAEEKIQLVSANSFIVPGDLKLDEVNTILHLNLHSEEMNTLGGWVLEQFGYLPSPGMVVVKNKVLFTVEDVAQRRITSVRIRI